MHSTEITKEPLPVDFNLERVSGTVAEQEIIRGEFGHKNLITLLIKIKTEDGSNKVALLRGVNTNAVLCIPQLGDKVWLAIKKNSEIRDSVTALYYEDLKCYGVHPRQMEWINLISSIFRYLRKTISSHSFFLDLIPYLLPTILVLGAGIFLVLLLKLNIKFFLILFLGFFIFFLAYIIIKVKSFFLPSKLLKIYSLAFTRKKNGDKVIIKGNLITPVQGFPLPSLNPQPPKERVYFRMQSEKGDIVTVCGTGTLFNTLTNGEIIVKGKWSYGVLDADEAFFVGEKLICTLFSSNGKMKTYSKDSKYADFFSGILTNNPFEEGKFIKNYFIYKFKWYYIISPLGLIIIFALLLWWIYRKINKTPEINFYVPIQINNDRMIIKNPLGLPIIGEKVTAITVTHKNNVNVKLAKVERINSFLIENKIFYSKSLLTKISKKDLVQISGRIIHYETFQYEPHEFNFSFLPEIERKTGRIYNKIDSPKNYHKILVQTDNNEYWVVEFEGYYKVIPFKTLKLKAIGYEVVPKVLYAISIFFPETKAYMIPEGIKATKKIDSVIMSNKTIEYNGYVDDIKIIEHPSPLYWLSLIHFESIHKIADKYIYFYQDPSKKRIPHPKYPGTKLLAKIILSLSPKSALGILLNPEPYYQLRAPAFAMLISTPDGKKHAYFRPSFRYYGWPATFDILPGDRLIFDAWDFAGCLVIHDIYNATVDAFATTEIWDSFKNKYPPQNMDERIISVSKAKEFELNEKIELENCIVVGTPIELKMLPLNHSLNLYLIKPDGKLFSPLLDELYVGATQYVFRVQIGNELRSITCKLYPKEIGLGKRITIKGKALHGLIFAEEIF